MILNRQRSVRVARRALETFLRRLQDDLGLSHAELTVAFVSDFEIARMNQTYRKKRGATDVLSFPTETRRRPMRVPLRQSKRTRGVPQAALKKYLGDIAISPGTARRNAARFGRSLSVELRILVLHGVLHLVGYDHETDRGEMERLEARLRTRFGLA